MSKVNLDMSLNHFLLMYPGIKECLVDDKFIECILCKEKCPILKVVREDYMIGLESDECSCGGYGVVHTYINKDSDEARDFNKILLKSYQNLTGDIT